MNKFNIKIYLSDKLISLAVLVNYKVGSVPIIVLILYWLSYQYYFMSQLWYIIGVAQLLVYL